MILGIGIDLAEIAKIEDSVKKEAFRLKVFSPQEIHLCEQYSSSVEHFAGKFAAKEAFMKAIGRGIRQEIGFTQIEVLNTEEGAPYIRVNGEADRELKVLDVHQIHVSISHNQGMAVAVVILER